MTRKKVSQKKTVIPSTQTNGNQLSFMGNIIFIYKNTGCFNVIFAYCNTVCKMAVR